MQAQQYIRRATIEAQSILDDRYAMGQAIAGGPLDQFGLRDGREIVEQFLQHGEPGFALEHLLYMIVESLLELSPAGKEDVRHAAELLGMTHLMSQLHDTTSQSTTPGGE